jgi:hypothetical protein
MGFGRKLWRPGAAIVLLATAGVGAAAPFEPLIVTQLADPETKLQISTASEKSGAPDGDIGDFSRAISEAVRTQQQSVKARCKSANTVSRPIVARWAWEASCGYQRH